MIAQDVGVALEAAAIVGVVTGYPPSWSWRRRLAVAGAAAGGGIAFLIGGALFAGVACLVLGAVIVAGPWLPGAGRWRR